MDWFENDAFWHDVESFLFTEDRLLAAEDEVSALLSLVGVPVRDVLDLCCGPGRHCVVLARRGMRVTGVDRTESYLVSARERSARTGVHVEWVREDMRRFRRPGAYDLVVNLFSSFGYFESDDDDRRVLANVRDSLRPGGVFVIDLVNKAWLVDNFHDTTSWDLPDGAVLIERHRVRDDWRRIENDWILVRGESARRYRLMVRLYAADEVRSLLADAGFGAVDLFGDLEGAPHDRTSKRLVARAVR